MVNWFKSPPAAATKSLQSCPTLCDPIDGSPPGSPIPGILQARTLEWVAISFPNVWKWKMKTKSLSHVQLLVTPWTAAYQAPPSMGFARQEYWSGVPLPSPKSPPSPHHRLTPILHHLSFLSFGSFKVSLKLWRCTKYYESRILLDVYNLSLSFTIILPTPNLTEVFVVTLLFQVFHGCPKYSV